MNVTIIPATELTAEHVSAWSAIQHSLPELDSPYLSPYFTQVVAAVRDDVEVAVIEKNNCVTGYFPFQRSGRTGRPVGGRLNDFQAVIAPASGDWDVESLMRECGLRCWDFDHVVGTQTAFQPFVREAAEFASIQTAGGLDGMMAARHSKSDEVRHAQRKARKVEREIGPYRFEFHSSDADALATLLEWKSAQYQASKITDVFSFPWTVNLIRRLHEQTGEFGGVLSLLYFNDDLVAAHFGLRYRHVLHWWFPAYDHRLSKYSPGTILLVEAIKACPDAGIERIDLGKVSPWKTRLLTDTRTVGEGAVDLRPVARLMKSTLRNTKQWVKQSPLYGPARVPARMAYHVREWFEFK